MSSFKSFSLVSQILRCGRSCSQENHSYWPGSTKTVLACTRRWPAVLMRTAILAAVAENLAALSVFIGRARQRFRSDGAMTSASWPILPCRGQRKILIGRDIPRRLITLSFPIISRGTAFSSPIAVGKCVAATLHAVPRDAIGIEIHRAAIALGPPPFAKTGIETFLLISSEGKLLQSDRLLTRA
jgi:hypothetical protein